MNEELEFLEDYLAWVNNSAPEPNEYFKQNAGLCSNAVWYGVRKEIVESWFMHSFPFNYNEIHYYKERNKTLNPKRIQWVKDRISFLKNETI